MQCLGGSPGHCTSQHRPAPALHMLSFENFVKSMPPSLSELLVTPSFCFAFKIPDDVTASIYMYMCCIHYCVGCEVSCRVLRFKIISGFFSYDSKWVLGFLRSLWCFLNWILKAIWKSFHSDIYVILTIERHYLLFIQFF